jgi:trigger factor
MCRKACGFKSLHPHFTNTRKALPWQRIFFVDEFFERGTPVTLTIHTEEDNQRQLTVTVEVAEERVQQALRAKARKLAKDIHVPGFRKGKAPYQVILRRVGEEALRAETLEDMVQPIFEEVIRDNEIELYGQPSLDHIETNPMVFRFIVPIAPKVELGDYRAVRRDVVDPQVTDEALAAALEQVRVRHQAIEVVDRPVMAGDVVTLSGVGKLAPQVKADEAEEGDGETAVSSAEETLFEEDHTELLMDANVLFPGTSFVDHIIGMSAGEEKQFSFTFAADYEDNDLAGREANFSVYLLEVKNRTLPELDDDLAKLEGSYETLEELRQSLHDNLQQQAEAEASNELIERMIDDLIASAKISYPPVAVEQELDNMMESLKKQVTRSGWQWEDYVRMSSMSEAEMRESFQENAQRQLERQLALRQFVVDEKLSVNARDIDKKIEARLDAFGDNKELKNSLREYFSTGYGFETLSSEVLMDKVVTRIKTILVGEAPDLDSLEVADAIEQDEEE